MIRGERHVQRRTSTGYRQQIPVKADKTHAEGTVIRTVMFRKYAI